MVFIPSRRMMLIAQSKGLQVDRAELISDALHVPLFLGTGIQQGK